MPLPAPSLDDRRFQDLVDEAKRAIPAHCPEWTNHNLNDPGVALIELFAWMGEQLLFRLNQVPDRLYVHFLNLMGIDLFPPGVARGEATFWLSESLDHDVVVPRGTEITTDGSVGTPVVFTTVEDLTIAPPRPTCVLTVAEGARPRIRDVTVPLRSGLPVPFFGGDPGQESETSPRAGDAVHLGFAAPLHGAALRLTVRAGAEGIGIDPSDPPLNWEAWTGEGWAPTPVHRDTTGGLNRDGEIVLLLPSRHEPVTFAGVHAHWVRVVLRAPGPGRPGYRRTPVLTGLEATVIGGTVVVEHAEPFPAEHLGRSDGRAGQVFRTVRCPVLARRTGERVEVTGPGGVTSWEEVTDFSASGPTDRHVVWDGTTGEIRFGPAVRYADGTVVRHGATPPDGATVQVTGYRVGGGAAGNVGAGTLVRLRSPLPYVTGVVNLRAATGGVDAETVDEAKIRGPLTLRTGLRAVTASDYEHLALQADPAVARARCLPPEDAGGAVRLLLVPRQPPNAAPRDLDDLALAPGMVSAVCRLLDERRAIGTVVDITTPFYQGVSVASLVVAGTGRSAPVVRQAAVSAVTAFLDPVHGGPHGDGWPFGNDLTAAAVAQLLESVDGVERVEEVLLFEYDLRNGRRFGAGREALALAPNSLFLLAVPAVVVR